MILILQDGIENLQIQINVMLKLMTLVRHGMDRFYSMAEQVNLARKAPKDHKEKPQLLVT
jgi:hypothetical protein